MSRIREKLSKIFASQIPEFIRVGETDATNIQVISTTAASKQVTVSDTRDIIAGDRLQHPAITNTVFVTKILSTTKLEVSNAIAVTLSNQVAKFIRADSTSTFVKFLEAYYKFLEQDQYPQEILQNARKYGDSEYTTDNLIEQFFKNYGNDIPRNIVTEKRTFIKHFRDIYKTKGTEEAYKLLFRVMFNSNAEFFYPSEFILKPSDGIWKKDKTIIVTPFNQSNLYDLVNTKIVGNRSGASADVNSVIKVYQNIGYNAESYELTLENVKGNFLVEEITASKLINATTGERRTIIASTLPQLTNLTITDSLPGYEANAEIKINGANVAIDYITNTGKIKTVRIINSGVYLGRTIVDGVVLESSFEPVYIDPPTRNILGNITITSNVATFVSNTPHGFSKGNYANVYFYGNAASAVNGLVSNVVIHTILDDKRFRFTYVTADTNTNANLIYTQPAILKSNLGILREGSGYWKNGQGKLSSAIYIQGPAVDAPDPRKIYYQPYSYVVKSQVSLDNWAAVAASIVHPAGMQVFSEIDNTNKVLSNISTTVNNEVWDYLGITADMDSPPFEASMTTYSNSRVANLDIKSDHVYYLFSYL